MMMMIEEDYEGRKIGAGISVQRGLRLPGPNPNLSVEEVRNLYASAYPEITTAAIEGPEVVGNKLVYRLTRAIGTKGWVRQPCRRGLPRPCFTIREHDRVAPQRLNQR